MDEEVVCEGYFLGTAVLEKAFRTEVREWFEWAHLV